MVNFKFSQFIFWYFIFITVDFAFVSLFTSELMILVGMGFYFMAGFVFSLFLKKLTIANMFCSLPNLITQIFSLLMVLVIDFSVIDDYLLFFFSFFVIIPSIVHLLSINNLLLVIECKAKLSIIISSLLQAFNDFVGVIKFFKVVFIPNFFW
ncbi:hypothetical protein EGI31_18335 [Lacihabitans soyangensis]|uniref:Uncharacterized protein n=1 Tax=Lacihabitans soyangensis TaxID=869394 RepID=A0AAE3H4P1_9BACT|nr:hypothetical protein [Lacihabitans soyangensis]